MINAEGIQRLSGSNDVIVYDGQDNRPLGCFNCRIAGLDCLVERTKTGKPKAKCATCGEECSLNPSNDSAQQVARLTAMYGALTAAAVWITSDGSDSRGREEARAQIMQARDMIPRVTLRFGKLEWNGQVIDHGL